MGAAVNGYNDALEGLTAGLYKKPLGYGPYAQNTALIEADCTELHAVQSFPSCKSLERLREQATYRVSHRLHRRLD